MIVISNFQQVTAQIEVERGVPRAILSDAIEQALVSACRRRFSESAILEAQINQDSGEVHIFRKWTVVAAVADPEIEKSVDEAKTISPDPVLGTTVSEEVTPDNFGRIAAQTAKQVIIQRIREAEKNTIFDELKPREGSIITGTVQRIEGANYLVNLGRVETLLTPKDQVPGEQFNVKDKIRLFLVSVNRTSRGPEVIVSRTNAGLVKKLFEMEVPEIHDGIIEVMSVSRDPGKRTKVAVKSNNPSVGAVGTCVGHMGGRIQTIIKELGSEKIDILEWSDSAKLYIANSLKPAKISEVIVTNDVAKTAVVVVPKDQLSLAIGKGGINVRLAVRLTGWNLDIMSEDEFEKKADEIRKKTHVSIVDRIRNEKQKMQLEEAAPPRGREVELETTMKLSDLAKLLQLKVKDLVSLAKENGIKANNGSRVLSNDEIDILKSKVSG